MIGRNHPSVIHYGLVVRAEPADPPRHDTVRHDLDRYRHHGDRGHGALPPRTTAQRPEALVKLVEGVGVPGWKGRAGALALTLWVPRTVPPPLIRAFPQADLSISVLVSPARSLVAAFRLAYLLLVRVLSWWRCSAAPTPPRRSRFSRYVTRSRSYAALQRLVPQIRLVAGARGDASARGAAGCGTRIDATRRRDR